MNNIKDIKLNINQKPQPFYLQRKYLLPFVWFICLFLPFILNQAETFIAIIFAVYAIVALSEDVVLGRAGMYDMGHAVYFGIGAYTSAILNITFGWPIVLTWPVAILISILMGIILSAPIVKLRGDYLLVVTIGINEIFVLALKNNLGGLTGGADGIFGVGAPSFFGYEITSAKMQFITIWIGFAFILWLINNLDRSHLGRVFYYLKHDQLAATTMGVSARKYRIMAFAIGAGISGFAGTMFASLTQAVSPETFNFIQSVTLFAIVLVGGQGSIIGVLIGTFLMFVVPEIFSELQKYRFLVFGILIIVIMVIRPQGIWPRKESL